VKNSGKVQAGKRNERKKALRRKKKDYADCVMGRWKRGNTWKECKTWKEGGNRS